MTILALVVAVVAVLVAGGDSKPQAGHGVEVLPVQAGEF